MTNGHLKTDIICENGHLPHAWNTLGKLFSLFNLAWVVASELTSSAGHIVNSTCVSRFLPIEFWNVSNKTFDFKCPFFKKRSVNLNAPHLKSKEKNGLTCPFFISDNQKMKLFNYCGGGFKLEPVLTIFNVRLS